jgi:hypothetical protein
LALDVVEEAALLERSGADALQRYHLEHDGWSLEFFFFPKSESARGQYDTQPIGVYSPAEAQWVDSRSPLLNAVLKKASRYGDLEHPYVIAVNTLGFPLKRIDVMQALFGKERVTLYFAGDEVHSHEMTRRPDGALTTFSGPRSTRVSSVLHVSTIVPWSVAAMEPCLYHNPYAREPYAGDLDRLPHARGVEGEMKWFEGVHPRNLFGLSADWPGRHED